MESFLEYVSADLYDKYGANLSKLCLIFPSRRARLFFIEALSTRITQPVWMPQALSISDLIFQWAGRRPSDPLRLIAELYKVAQVLSATGRQDAQMNDFDTFFHRGEVLLHDFDQVDKYLVPAKALFQNLRDQKVLEGDFSFLKPEQVAAIQQFWSTFTPQKSKLQESFTQMWALLYPLYSQFRKVLVQKGLAYEGMLYREVAEGEITPDPAILSYIFIGFNALNNCERKVFSHLQALGSASFYWDYDDYYVHDKRQEAGMFLRKNLKEFPPNTFSDSHRFSLPKEIESWAVPSDVLQTKLVPQIIKENHLHTDKRTAVVLCNESLLIPLLSSLSSLDIEINVTMGYPFAKTSLYSFTEALLLLYRSARMHGNLRSYYHVEVLRLLNHPITSYLCPKAAMELKKRVTDQNILFVSTDAFSSDFWLEQISRYPTDPKSWLTFLTELFEAVEETVQQAANNSTRQIVDDSIHRWSAPDPLLLPVVKIAAMEVAKFRNTIQSCGIDLSIPMLFNLLRKMLGTISVPFSGEPLQGIQVMGFLETRALDFEHVVLLSAQEESLPSANESSSFIPYNLRAGFGLPVQEEREAMYAYYFYRLIQRTKKVSLLYSTGGDGIQTGEQSRYILQLEAESPHTLAKKRLSMPVILPPVAPKIEIAKMGEHKERLLQYLNPDTQRPLTPSAINTFLQCPLRFCYQYIERIKEARDVEEDADGRTTGTILHSAMELLYTSFVGKTIDTPSLEYLLGEKRTIRYAVEEAIQKEYACHNSAAVQLSDQGRWLILADIMTEYVTQVIRYDVSQTPFTLIALEKSIQKLISLPFLHAIPIGGTIDRVHELNGICYIVDYKTGRDQRSFSSLEALFSPEQGDQNSAVFQILWYVMLYMEEEPQKKIAPMLYYVRSLFDPKASTLLRDKSSKQEIIDTSFAETFRTLLGQKLAELFDLSQPFSQTTDTQHCTYCAYNRICQRK